MLYAAHLDTLFFIDVSNPLLPEIVNEFIVDVEEYESQLGFRDLHLKDNRLLMSHYYGDPAHCGHFGLTNIDISDPFNPFEINTTSVWSGSDNSSLNDFKIYDNLLFLTSDWHANQGGGVGSNLRVYDISDISFPELLFNLSIWGEMGSADGMYNLVEVNHDLMFTAHDNLAVYDISDLSDPVMINQIDLGGVANDLQYDDSHIYLSKDDSFEIYRIHSSASMTLVGSIEGLDNFSDFAIDEEFVIAITNNSLRIFDCSAALNAPWLNYIGTPNEFEITNAYPNPFNPILNVSIAMPQTSKLKVSVFNIMGQEVATLADRQYSAGIHNFVFNANEVTSHSSGVYFVHASVPGKLNQVKKVVLMK